MLHGIALPRYGVVISDLPRLHPSRLPRRDQAARAFHLMGLSAEKAEVWRQQGSRTGGEAEEVQGEGGDMTPAERQERFDALTRIGCICCRVFHGVHTAPQIHHLTGLKYRAMGKKADDAHTIPLCVWHHTGGHPSIDSVHHHTAAFKRMYGTQEELLDMTNKMIEAAK